MWKVIKNSAGGKLEEKIVRYYTKQILEGLVYLHSNNVIHLDLKARNILIDAGNVLKLADFGLSMRLREDTSTTRQFSTCKGTCTHIAPEMIDPKCGKYGRKVDIWLGIISTLVQKLLFLKDIQLKFRALGVTMVEMLTGTHPWPDLNENLQFFFKLIHLKESEIPTFDLDESTSVYLHDFLRSTFVINYVNRPSASDLLEHNFIKLEN